MSLADCFDDKGSKLSAQFAKYIEKCGGFKKEYEDKTNTMLDSLSTMGSMHWASMQYAQKHKY